MATNGAHAPFTPQNVLAGMVTMRGGDSSKKEAAMDYLFKFQKSVRTNLASLQRPVPASTDAWCSKMLGR